MDYLLTILLVLTVALTIGVASTVIWLFRPIYDENDDWDLYDDEEEYYNTFRPRRDNKDNKGNL